jgi:hypothetical protein
MAGLFIDDIGTSAQLGQLGLDCLIRPGAVRIASLAVRLCGVTSGATAQSAVRPWAANR